MPPPSKYGLWLLRHAQDGSLLCHVCHAAKEGFEYNRIQRPDGALVYLRGDLRVLPALARKGYVRESGRSEAAGEHVVQYTLTETGQTALHKHQGVKLPRSRRALTHEEFWANVAEKEAAQEAAEKHQREWDAWRKRSVRYSLDVDGTTTQILRVDPDNAEQVAAAEAQGFKPYSFPAFEVPWEYACRQAGTYPAATPRNGKWLVFLPDDLMSAVWERVKAATEEGRLGSSAKVSTQARNGGEKVICVYTYDWTDQEDVRRVRQELRALGITKKIPYKTDEDTLNGVYRRTGHTKIAKYFE